MQLATLTALLAVLAVPGMAAPHRRAACRPRPHTASVAPEASGAAASSASAVASAVASGAVASDSAAASVAASAVASGTIASASAVASGAAASDSASVVATSSAEPSPSADPSPSAAPSAAQLIAEQSSADPSSAVPSSTASAAPTATSASSFASSGGAAAKPGGRKAGISSGMGIDMFKSKIGWYYDWTPNPPAVDGVLAVPMLWGDGHLGADQQDASRFAAFEALPTSPAPQFVIGFEEPDCVAGSGSAGISDPASAAATWDQQMGRFKNAGTLLVSPSMCHQAADVYLTPFEQAATVGFDVTNLHINKNSRDGILADIEHYAQYGKPMWVTEFACVDDSNGFTPCTDDGEIAQFISDIVDILEGDDRITAYAFSNGLGLGDKWTLTNEDGSQLSAAGQAYLDAISKY